MKKVITFISGLLFLSQLLPAVASPPTRVKSKSFTQWCQENAANSLSTEAGKTVSILLRHVKTIDCKQANSRLKNITSLDLSGKQIRDLQALGSLNHLTSLNLKNNKICDLKPLTSLTKLKKLILTKNKIGQTCAADLEPISALYELRELYLDDNEGISNLESLSTLRNLKKLEVSKNAIDYQVCPIKGKSICIF
jgi:internalin A